MGTLTYDGTVVDFDDRLLAHLQIVLVKKFLKHEPFLMSWKDSNAVGDGRGSMWMTPNAPVYFKFLGSKVPAINEEWLLMLGKSADSPRGLIVTNEQGNLALSSDSGARYPGDLGPN